MHHVQLKTMALAVALAATALTACARPPETGNSQVVATSGADTPTTDNPATETKMVPMVVHKSAYCGCCEAWVDHMRKAGFAVEARNVDNINAIKQEVGVPFGKGSCHTAQVGGYFIEGHVPAADVRRLLAESPDAKGLVLPGMPKGSPGMESPDGTSDAYTVELVANDGSTTPFAQH